MLYLTSAHPSLVAYHASNTGTRLSIVSEPDELSLRRCVSTGGRLRLVDGELVNELSTYLVNLDVRPIKDLRINRDNTTYLVLPEGRLGEWSKLIKEGSIELLNIDPEDYIGSLDKAKAIFEQPALTWFWDKYKNYPIKREMELSHLIMLFTQVKRKLTLEDVESICHGDSTDNVLSYVYHIGTSEGTRILRDLDSSSLWSLFIGSERRPPYLHGYLVSKGRCPLLYGYINELARNVIDEGLDLRIGSILLNEWLIQSVVIDKRNPYKWGISFNGY